jgi:hypothetical protein
MAGPPLCHEFAEAVSLHRSSIQVAVIVILALAISINGMTGAFSQMQYGEEGKSPNQPPNQSVGARLLLRVASHALAVLALILAIFTTVSTSRLIDSCEAASRLGGGR